LLSPSHHSLPYSTPGQSTAFQKPFALLLLRYSSRLYTSLPSIKRVPNSLPPSFSRTELLKPLSLSFFIIKLLKPPTVFITNLLSRLLYSYRNLVRANLFTLLGRLRR
jgi:hypothetical protein